jgi:N-acylneuraminate cytidylyltransferase/CMP-N,N'-diacetyllegionaminic acid synthase
MIRYCTICARGGSKGAPGKNTRDLYGKPMIAYTIEQAKKSGLFEIVGVSSDSEKILDAARDHGADILVRRPHDLASDAAAKVPAIKHCLEAVEREMGKPCTVFADLDVTSPLRLPEDIIGAVRLLEDRGVSNVITGTVARHSPYFSCVEIDAAGVPRVAKTLGHPIVCRQDAPPCFDMNASVYAWRRDVFMRNPSVFYDDTLLFEMPPERSVDVDSEFDFEMVKFLMGKALGLA